jgi:hypothetical protein
VASQLPITHTIAIVVRLACAHRGERAYRKHKGRIRMTGNLGMIGNSVPTAASMVKAEFASEPADIIASRVEPVSPGGPHVARVLTTVAAGSEELAVR